MAEVTISGISGPHELEAEFALTQVAGSFTTTDAISGLGVYQIQSGSLSTVDTLSGDFLQQIQAGALSETGTLTGDIMQMVGPPAAVTYQCVLTGTSDLTLPISSFQARIRSGDPTYLEVVVPDAAAYADDIADRTAGEIIVRQAANVWEDGTIYYAEIARADFETLQSDQGPSAYTVRISGHRTETYATGTSRGLQNVSTISTQADGKRRIRCAVDFIVRPGFTATWNDGDDSMTVGMITLTVSVLQQTMDITEA